MDINHINGLVGNFTWNFANKFFIETVEGNFVWSDPDYPGGDNSITPYAGDYKQWINGRLGRNKGKHIIRSYCGDSVFLSV